MDKSSEIEFNVDEQYENEKGVFTVISKDADEMVIRWENGEEIRTDIELQRRIIARRRREAAQRALEAEAAAKSDRKGRAAEEKKPFSGLNAEDFKNSASGTRWRSRNQLGGAVVRQMVASGFKFNSWAFGNKPEMHIQDAGHRKQGTAEEQAKFFVALDEKALYYGFKVPRDGKKGGSTKDWKSVAAWLAAPENDTMLRSLAAEEDLQVDSPETPAFGVLRGAEDSWYRKDQEATQPLDALSAHIDRTAGSAPFELRIAAVVPKADAVAQEAAIAETIAQLFTRLLPLYRTESP